MQYRVSDKKPARLTRFMQTKWWAVFRKRNKSVSSFIFLFFSSLLEQAVGGGPSAAVGDAG